MTVTSMMSPISLTQFFYENGTLVKPARLFFTHPETTDPLTVYTDAGLGVPHDSPVVTGGKGRCPPVYVGPNPYRIRVFDSRGALVEEIPLLQGAPVLGDDGTPGSVLTPAEKLQLLQTGDMVHMFSNAGPRSGFVRANGMLIAHPSFGGVGYNIERQNADVEFLFKWLWGQAGNDILPVIGGRGASSTDDWAAMKAIALPDLRGRELRALDGMGHSILGSYNNVPLPTGSGIRAGSYGGQATTIITVGQIPAHAHANTASGTGAWVGSGATGITINSTYASMQPAAAIISMRNAFTGIASATGGAYAGVTGQDLGHQHQIPATNDGTPGYGAYNPFHVMQNPGVGYTTTAQADIRIYEPAGGHTHTINDPSHIHTLDQTAHSHVPDLHSHSITDLGHVHVLGDPGHTHTMSSVGGGAILPTTDLFLLCAIYIKL
jgi:hypothetical protein